MKHKVTPEHFSFTINEYCTVCGASHFLYDIMYVWHISISLAIYFASLSVTLKSVKLIVGMSTGAFMCCVASVTLHQTMSNPI